MAAPETAEQKYELAEKQGIIVSLALAKKVERAVQQARVSPVPVDLTSVFAEALAVILRNQAFLLDDSLAMTGAERTIQIQPVERGNGNGQDGPPRLVMP